jgi:hypothetical protein
MVTNKKKRPLSGEDKSKLTTFYHVLQWKGLNTSAAALAKEADLTIPSQKPKRQSQEVLWSRLPNSPDEESESDSDSSESDSDGDNESSSSERTTIVQKKVSEHPPSAELTAKKLPNAIKKEESGDSDSSESDSDGDTDSSSSERTTIVQTKVSVHPPSAELTVKKLPNATQKEESSDSDSDRDSDDEDEETSDTDSSSASSSDDDEVSLR